MDNRGFIEQHKSATNKSEDGVYKLHISLAHDEVPNYFRAVIALLQDALNHQIIEGFKYTNDKKVYLEEIEKFKQQLEKPNSNDNDHETIKLCIKQRQRLLQGDQFTIYLDKKIDQKKLRQLCSDIENCLIKAKAGEFALTESPISKHISLRQDFFEIPKIKRSTNSTDPNYMLFIDVGLARPKDKSSGMFYLPAVFPDELADTKAYPTLSTLYPKELKKLVNVMHEKQENSELYSYLSFSTELKKLHTELDKLEKKLAETNSTNKNSLFASSPNKKIEKLQEQCEALIKNALKQGIYPEAVRNKLLHMKNILSVVNHPNIEKLLGMSLLKEEVKSAEFKKQPLP